MQNVSIYNPLAKGSTLYRTWTALGSPSSLTPQPTAPLVQRYVEHSIGISTDRNSRTSGLQFAGERRRIVRDIKALLDVVILGPPFDGGLSESGIELYFPILDQYDARAVEIGDHRAVFISSRTLDAIEFFAHCMGTWSLLNSHLSERSLPPAAWPVPYAWIPFLINEGNVDLDEVPTGYSDYHNRLIADFLRGMITLLEVPQTETKSILQVGPELVGYDRNGFIEPRYLAAVTLLYVCLHECAHIFLAHNEPIPRLTSIQRLVEQVVDQSIEAQNEAAGEVVGQRLWDKDSSLGFSLEIAADIHAVHSTTAEYGDAVLEAASLWLTALGTCRPDGADLFDAFKQSTGDEHPPYPTRVWALNGALSSFARKGQVAESARRAAELMAGAAVPFKPEMGRRTMHAGRRWKWVRVPWRN